MKARYYDPEAGRFVGPDPVGVLESVETNPQMFNRYAYANNNPFSFIDPDGRAPKGRGDGSGASAAGALIGCMIGNCNPRLSRTMAATAAKDGNYNIAGSIALNGGMKSKDFVSMVDKVQNKKGAKRGNKTFQTYTKTNPKTGQQYCGRTSGCGTPEQNIARRDANHHMNQDGYGPATLDKSSRACSH